MQKFRNMFRRKNHNLKKGERGAIGGIVIVVGLIIVATIIGFLLLKGMANQKQQASVSGAKEFLSNLVFEANRIVSDNAPNPVSDIDQSYVVNRLKKVPAPNGVDMETAVGTSAGATITISADTPPEITVNLDNLFHDVIDDLKSEIGADSNTVYIYYDTNTKSYKCYTDSGHTKLCKRIGQ